MICMRGKHENLYFLNTHSSWRYKLQWSYQMTCAVDTPIKYTFCWHLFLCYVMNDQKKENSYSTREFTCFCKWLTNFITELYLVPDCGIDGSLSAPTIPGIELITLTRLSSFHFAVVRLLCFHFYRPFCTFFFVLINVSRAVWKWSLKIDNEIQTRLKYGRKS